MLYILQSYILLAPAEFLVGAGAAINDVLQVRLRTDRRAIKSIPVSRYINDAQIR